MTDRILNTIAMGVALTIPICAVAQDQQQRQRYYDRHHRDYHEFDERENRAWRMYAAQQRHADWRWEQANERRRQQ
jgi:hypothetical protein